MTGLYGWKPTSAAKIYLDEADRRAAIEREAARTNERDQKSRDWLADYLSQPNRPSVFNWSPSIVTTAKLEEGLHAQEAEARRTSQAAAEIDLRQGVGDAASEPVTPRLGEYGDSGQSLDAGHATRSAQPEHKWISDPIPF